MNINKINDVFSVSPQIHSNEIEEIKALGFKSIICNRPDGEGADQENFAEVEAAAKKAEIAVVYLPVISGKVEDDDAVKFAELLKSLPSPTLAYCRTGTRSVTLWSLSSSDSAEVILEQTKQAGYDMSGVVRRIKQGATSTKSGDAEYDIVVVGAGAAGIAVTASLLNRKSDLKIALIDPAEEHYYQPGWTLVGAGIFTQKQTMRKTASLIPKKAEWIKAAVASFEPNNNAVILENCVVIKYSHLVVCPGIKLDWHKVEGLVETLGKNGVTSNYRYDLAPYTWELVKSLKSGKAVFTQPPMPIKCAGAPQKAMYMSSDHWYRTGNLKNIDVQFYNQGAVLFGVKDYVPALMEYIKKYDATLNFGHNLVKVDGESKKAWFETTCKEGKKETVCTDFDMLHVSPPQTAPDFIKASPLVDDNGWVDVDQSSLQHKKYSNIYSLGDVMNTPNAKTAAAARMQAPVVADNLIGDITGSSKARSIYNGYGSCPLTVEKGKIVLAEFGYGGKILNSFPSWILNGFKPTRMAWILKKVMLPPIYWMAMLKGREVMAKPAKAPSAK